jgi:hypothetical protein
VVIGEWLYPNNLANNGLQIPRSITIFPARYDDAIPLLLLIIVLAESDNLTGNEFPARAHFIQTVEYD